jgi:Zn-dependent protease/predicted transcriptional regulator
MKWSLYIGKVAGIKIFIHWTFLILILFVIQTQLVKGSNFNEILLALGFIAAVFVCITLHELGHAITAKHYHFKTKDIILLPVGGLARMEGLPEKPSQELAVAIMGPIVNLVIAAGLYLALRFTSSIPDLSNETQITAGNFWFYLYSVNFFLALFNLIPAFPMDGGRILRALLSFRLSRTKATRIAANFGQIIAICFVLAGFYVNPMLIFIGLFVFLGAQAEKGFEELKATLKGIKVNEVLMNKYSVLAPAEPLSHAISLLLETQEKSFVIEDNGELKGTLSWKDIIAGLAQYRPDVMIKEVMNKNPRHIKSDEPLENVIQKMQEEPHVLYPVYSGNEFVGVLDMENINEYLLVQNALKR